VTIVSQRAGRKIVRRRAWLALGFALCGAPFHAQAGDHPQGKIVAARNAELESGDPARVTAALGALGERGGAGSVAALARFIRAGQPDALTDRALTALGQTHAPQALEPLAELIHHRRVAARVAAYAAIADIAGARADELLAQGLRDSDSAVRGTCARKLGERKATSQLDVLLRAFERGVPEAAVAVGRIADAGHIARFHAQLGHAPILLMLSGYEPLLLRADVDEATKLDVIARLGEVASVSVKRFLERMSVEHDWKAQPRLRTTLVDTARRIDERPKPATPGAAP
jgi:HEAT repeat protein